MNFTFGGRKAAPGAKDDSGLIKDTTTQEFVRDVIEASRKVPVLVDFWAPWCGPCKQLTPVLEKLVKAAKGAVRLVKMNIDDHPAVAGQLGVQSIPAVFAFKNGQPVDGFMGALPESQVKEFIKRVMGVGGAEAATSDLEEAEAVLAEGDINTAAGIFAAALQQDSENAEAAAGLTKCYINTGDLKRAEQTLTLIPPAKATVPAVASAKAMLELAKKTAKAGDAASLRATVEREPQNFEARYNLALVLNAAGEREEAADQLLEIIRRNRTWNEDAARKQLLEFFEAWGATDPHTLSGRRQLSSILFA
jgi:putative thioredoxin